MEPVRTWGWGVEVDGQWISLAEVEAAPVRSVSQIERTGAAFVGCARSLHDAAEGFIAHARTSEQAPLDADVLATLRGVVSGAEEAHRAARAFLDAFEQRYRDDIAAAQRGQRMNNPALTG